MRIVTLVLVQSLGELVDSRGNFDALLEDSTLALDTHIAGPLHVAGEVSLGRKDIAANAVVTGILAEEVLMLRLPVLRLLGGALFRGGGNFSLRLCGWTKLL